MNVRRFQGFALGLLLHFLQVPLIVLAAVVAQAIDPMLSIGMLIGGPGFIGVTQFLYMAPAMRTARRNGDTELLKGLQSVVRVTIIANVGVVLMFFLLD